MYSSARDAYLESGVLAADPMELVRILYRTALDSVAEARGHLAGGDITARSRAISRAIGAIGELNSSLDHAAGGEFSRRLASLYEYMQSRLLEANCEQAQPPLDETAGLLATLLEAWQSVRPAPASPQPGEWGDTFAPVFAEEDGFSRINACA